MKKIAFATLSLFAFATSLQAQNSLDNGSFEFGTSDPANSAIQLAPTSTAVTSWTPKSPGAAYVGTVLTASDGKRSLYLTYSINPGGIEQTFASASGQAYRVYFDVSSFVGSDRSAAKLVTGKATALNGATAITSSNFSYDATGKSFPNVGWGPATFDFTATGPTTTIRFESTMPSGGFGAVIDNVRVVPGHADGANWVIDGAPVLDVPMNPTTKVAINTTAHFEVHALGAGPITYQWYWQRNSTTNVLNAGAILDITNIGTTYDGGRIFVVASNSVQKITNSTIVTVVQPPKIASQPLEQRISAGQQLNFGPSSFTGSAPDTFQWYKDSAPVDGQTNQFFTKNFAAITDSGNYYVMVANIAGQTNSVTVPITVVNGAVAPWLRAANPPASYLNVQQGGAISLFLNMQGTTPITYYWYKDDAFVQTTTSASFLKSPSVLADAGVYKTVASNSAGIYTTPTTLVQVYPPQTTPTFAYLSTNSSVAEGQSLTLTFPQTGGTFVRYQWWKRGADFNSLGTPLANETNITLALANITAAMAGTYTLEATNFVGGQRADYRLTVVSAPQLGTTLYGFEGPPGVQASISVQILNFDQSMTFKWYHNGQLVQGATQSSYSFTSSTDTAGDYFVVVHNPAGDATSGTIKVLVRDITASPLILNLVVDKTKEIPGRSGTLFGVIANGTLRNGVVTFEGRRDFNDIPGEERWQDGVITRIADGTTSLPGFTATADFITGVSAEDGGTSLFVASSTNSAADNQRGIFASVNGTLQIVANQQTTYPTKPGLKPTHFGYPTRVGNKAAFLLRTEGSNYKGIFVWDGAVLQKWVDVDGGLPAGDGIWDGNSSQVGFDGHTMAAWLVSKTTGDGIFASVDGAPLQKIAFVGDAIPGGGTFTGFVSPPLVRDGKILFFGSGGLYEWAAGVVRKVARPGDAVVGGGSFGNPSYTFNYDADGSIVFSGTGPGEKYGIYRERGGVITEELSTLNTVFGNSIKFVGLSDIDVNGDWLVNVTFTDNNSGLYIIRTQTQARPKIAIQRSGNGLHFSWSGAGKLQSSANLTDWSDASAPGVTSADVTIGASGNSFFRVAGQ